MLQLTIGLHVYKTPHRTEFLKLRHKERLKIDIKTRLHIVS